MIMRLPSLRRAQNPIPLKFLNMFMHRGWIHEEITFAQARRAMDEEMSRDERVFVLGDIARKAVYLASSRACRKNLAPIA